MDRTNARGDRAVVVGASLAGLLAARVLAEHFAEVIVLDRDTLPEGPAVRRGVPQARHAHLLMNRGVGITRRLFPTLFAEMEAAGAVPVDFGAAVRWFQHGSWKRRYPSGVYACFATRALLEWTVRSLLGAHANVRIAQGCAVRGLALEAGRVGGVRVEGEAGAPAHVDADLVVDASGRGPSTSIRFAHRDN